MHLERRTLLKATLLRARVMLLAVFLSMLAILLKVIYLQYARGDSWKAIAASTQLEYKPILASRGNIYADDGSLLATSLPFYRVALDTTLLSDKILHQEIDLLCQKLADFYGDHPASYYKERIIHGRNTKRRYLLLNKRYITYEDKKAMLRWPIMDQGRYKGGIIFEEQYRRYNPFQTLAKRTIGSYREVHRTGLEHAFNSTLQGRDGQALYQKVVGGNWRLIAEQAMIPPIDGYDLETTLDVHLQDITESSLLSVLEKSSARNGCAVVMEVSTGAVKAIANLTRTSEGKYVEAYNYAVGHQGTVEPGSIFKLVSMLALLEETDWPLTKPIDTGDGTMKFHNCWMRDVKKGGYGLLTLQELFEKSSNVGFAMAVHEIFGANPQKFIDYIEALHIDRPLGIELVGEGKPYVITPKSKWWNKITLPWLSIGYNLQITPLQMLTVFNAVANNGKMVKPMFVQHIKSANGIVEKFPTIVLKEKICSDVTLQKLKIMLAGTVERGLARGISHGFYKIAGKTGTAQKLVNKRYTNNHLTSFAGYFPVDNPRYSCIIVVDSPQGKNFSFGAQVPAPIFKCITDRLAGKDLDAKVPLNALTLPLPNPINLIHAGHIDELIALHQALHLPIPEKAAPGSWIRLKLNDQEMNEKLYHQPTEQVPQVVDMKLRDALFLLERSGLSVIIKGRIHGNVTRQSLPPYTALPDHRQITITLK